MKRLGVLANVRKPHSVTALDRLAKKAKDVGLTLATCDETGDRLPGATTHPPERLAHEVDAMMAMGGDGTMLRAVRLINGADTPVLGVNLGSLGFLTSVPEENLERAVDVLMAGDYTLSRRSLIDCRVIRAGREIAAYTALNDAVLGWGTSSRVVTLGLAIDGEAVAQYVCDGLIVSTPTGSTGHSLSSGGPIMHPEAAALTVNVICPHTLSARPLVLPDRSVIAVQVAEVPDNKSPLLSVDGQGEFPLEIGDRLEVRHHPHAVHFAHLPGYSYFAVLRQKLHWRGSSHDV